VLLALVGPGCGGSDDVTGPPVTNFAGEYTYVVTGAGGTCVDLPRATGSGVEIITQTEAWATYCFQRDLCDGEFCREGPVVGGVCTSDAEWTLTEGTCEYRTSRHIEATLDTDGVLHRRSEYRDAYVSGDCSAKVLPCDAWQTLDATPCTTPCYTGYCPAMLAPQPGAPGSGGFGGM
jgi:hypothetical protein